jgi:ribonucleoside-triphosphate reductase
LENFKIVKRDGVEQEFDTSKIFKAVESAAKQCVDEYQAHNTASEITPKVVSKVHGNTSVEDLQDIVEKTLMVSKYKDVAKSYIEYRKERDLVRNGKSQVFTDIDTFLNGENEEVSRENSNKPAEQVVSHRDLIAGIVSKHLADSVIPKDILQLHEEGGIHCHDKDYFISKGMHNCGVYNFEHMLKHGVKLGDVEIESPNSIQTASNVTCQVFSKISGSSYGGQSMHEFDVVMKPYVEKSLSKLRKVQETYSLPDSFVDEIIRKEVYDACQTFIYQIQTVTSSNGQAAFSTISLSLSQDPICKLIKEEYLKCHMKGIGPNGKTPIFPKVIYFVEDGVNLSKGNPNYEEFRLALECSSKQLYPDFVMAPNNRKMTGGSENVITPMG